MKEIKLTQGQAAEVFNKDFRWLKRWRWFAHLEYSGYYAVRTSNTEERMNGAPHMIYMHRVILGIVFEGRAKQGDHKNHNTLDNRRSNLKIVDTRGNQSNRKDQSKYGVGVEYYPKNCPSRPYRARVHIDGKKFISKHRATPQEAQRDYVNILKDNGLA